MSVTGRIEAFSGYGLWVAGCGLRVAGHGMRVAGYGYIWLIALIKLIKLIEKKIILTPISDLSDLRPTFSFSYLPIFYLFRFQIILPSIPDNFPSIGILPIKMKSFPYGQTRFFQRNSICRL
jgi:hypothetical protein